MNNKLVVFLLLLISAIIFFNACSKKNSSPLDPQMTSTIVQTRTITQTSTNIGTPTNTPTSTQTVTPIATVSHFASGLESWYRDVTGGGFTSIVYNSDPTYSALGTTGSVQETCNFTSTFSTGFLRKDFPSYIDLTGRTIRAYIYVPATLATISAPYTAFIEINSTSSGFTSGPSVNLNTAGWTLVQYTPSGVGENSVDRVIVGVYRNSPNDWSGTMYIDEISW